jgi:Beta-lactamase enzyme family
MFTNVNNNFYSEPNSYKVTKSNYSYQRGVVTVAERDNQLGNYYTVKLFKGGVILPSVRLVSNYGMNGLGEHRALNKGQPVLVSFNDGKMEDAFIVGSFTTEGNYETFYSEGVLQRPNELGEEDRPYNQPLGHPNRITQPNAQFSVTGIRSLDTPYDDPGAYSLEESYKHQERPGIIELRNDAGTRALYTVGDSIHFSDGNIFLISGGTKTDTTAKYSELAQRHCGKAEVLEQRLGVRPTSSTDEALPSGVVPLVTNDTPPSIDSSAIDIQYRIREERRLCEAYLEAAKGTLQQSAENTALAEDQQRALEQQEGQATAQLEESESSTLVLPNSIQSFSIQDITGKELFASNAAVAPASAAATINVILAALLVNQSIPLDEVITISRDVVDPSGSIRAGQKITVQNLITNMLKYSSSTSANALIKRMGGFSALTNALAAYPNTTIGKYLHVAGAPNQTTARDVSRAMRILINDPSATAIHAESIIKETKNYRYTGESGGVTGYNSSVIGNVGLMTVNNKDYIVTAYSNQDGNKPANRSVIKTVYDRAYTYLKELANE